MDVSLRFTVCEDVPYSQLRMGDIIDYPGHGLLVFLQNFQWYKPSDNTYIRLEYVKTMSVTLLVPPKQESVL